MRFVLIDRLVALEPGHRAGARVTFAPGADFFADHFPGMPIVPGVLLTESMGQTAGWLLSATSGFRHWPALIMIQQAKFLRHVTPGEQVDIEVQVRGVHERTAEVATVASVGGQPVARARLLFHENDLPSGESAAAFRQWAAATFRHLGGADLYPVAPEQGGSGE